MDRLLTRLERRFGRYAPSNITYWLVGLSGFVFALLFVKPELAPLFTLDPRLVMQGQVWRLATFLFLPWGGMGGGLFGAVLTFFALMFLYTVGTTLEAQWGSFRFDLYYLLGVAGTLLASFLFGSITNKYINLGLVLAFATEFPDYEVLLFVLPVKMKWLGLLDAGFLIFSFLTGSANARAGIMVAMLNYLLFFAGPLVDLARGKARQAQRRRSSPTSDFGPPEKRARVCAICGKSSVENPSLEFRVCDCAEKCRGKLTDYCLEHARNH